MPRAARIALSALLPAALCACSMPPPLDSVPGPLVQGTEPRYAFRPYTHEVVPTACQSRSDAVYGGLPQGCALDRAVGAQAADPRDLVHPRAPGRPYAAPAARAAEAYLYGDGPEDGGARLVIGDTGAGARRGGGERVDIEAEGAAGAETGPEG